MNEINMIIENLTKAIGAVMNPLCSHSDRITSNNIIEQFKSCQDPVLVLQVAMSLINEPSHSQPCTHFGLQLLEHVIKFNWNAMQVNMKQEMKQMIETWIDLNHHLVKSKVLMHAASRCIVEVMMREWPQLWPNLMTLLLSKPKSDLTLFVLWRVAEDVGVFFLPNNANRRREMNNQLNMHGSDINQYICDCLNTPDIDLCLLALKTISGFIEWCVLDTRLLAILCQIIDTDIPEEVQSIKVKQSTCECLLLCLGRKLHREQDKEAMKSLFSPVNMSHMMSSVRKMLATNANSNATQISCDKITLSKNLILVLAGLSQQINDINYIEKIKNEPHWNEYLDMMNSLNSHPNLIFNQIAIDFWLSFIRHNSIHFKTHPNYQVIFQSILSTIPTKLIKPKPSTSQLVFEFDSIEEYDTFYYKFRVENLDLLRQLTALEEVYCFNFVAGSMKSLFRTNSKSTQDWEIIAQLISAVCVKLSNLDQFCVTSNELVEVLLSTNNHHSDLNDDEIMIISSQLSCISALSIFFPSYKSVNLLEELVKKIFSLAIFSKPGESRSTRNKEVKNLRRHACSLFVKLCQSFPTLLSPMLNDLKARIDSFSANQQFITQMERCSLNEGLILISNELPDISQQRNFILEILSPISWISQLSLQPHQFISFIGVDKESSEDELLGKNRSQILYAVNIMLGVLKRVKKHRKDALLPHMLPFIQLLFPVIINLNAMWRNEVKEKCFVDYKNAIYCDITDTDRIHLFDTFMALPSTESPTLFSSKSASQRMQNFTWALHENCYSIIGAAASLLTPELYNSDMDFKTILNDLDCLPICKLRMILKCFLKPFIVNCPNEPIYYERLLVPILSVILPFMFSKMDSRWEEIKVRNMSDANDEPVEAELVKDEINRLLSREFIDLMLLMIIPTISVSKTNGSNDESMSELNSEEPVLMSHLGNHLIQSMPNLFIISSAKTLSWLDTNVSLKSCQLNSTILKKIIQENLIQSEDGANFLFEQILKGLNYFGEHDQNQAILLHLMLVLYENVVIKYGFYSVKVKLAELCECQVKVWDDFDAKFLIVPPNKQIIPEKRKKDRLKQIVSPLIGKNIGQLYKYNKVEVRNLKPLFKIDRTNPEEDILREENALCLLFNSK